MEKWEACFDLSSYIKFEVEAADRESASEVAKEKLYEMDKEELKELLYETFMFGGADLITVDDSF